MREHGGLGSASASQGTTSCVVGIPASLYPIKLGEETSDGLLQRIVYGRLSVHRRGLDFARRTRSRLHVSCILGANNTLGLS